LIYGIAYVIVYDIEVAGISIPPGKAAGNYGTRGCRFARIQHMVALIKSTQERADTKFFTKLFVDVVDIVHEII
jgi:hypothetical protein